MNSVNISDIFIFLVVPDTVITVQIKSETYVKEHVENTAM